MLRLFRHVPARPHISLHLIFARYQCIGRRLSSLLSCVPRLSDSVQLRPYQESCLQTCLEALREADTNRIGISLPTGSGKTTVFVSLISMLQSPEQSPEAKRALIIVNTVELARQSAEQVKRMFPNLIVEIDQGTKYKATGLADVTVATYQTLLRDARLSKFDPTKIKCIIVDEAHHAAAPSYRKILAHFDPKIRHPDVDFRPPTLPHSIPIVGFSATFSRHDGIALGSVFQRIVYHRDFLEMIKEQWLCNVRFTVVKADLNLSGVTINTRTGEFNPTSLAHVVNTETVNKLVVSTWLDKASATRKSTLVFCVNLSHLRELTNTFRQAGVDARYVYAGTAAKERKALIDAFKAGEFPVLLNVAILTEGADIPNIDCVILVKPTRSKNVFAQMIGRGMRLSPKTGKEDCHIIDFIDSRERVTGIVSTPTLFGLDPDEVIEDKTPEELEERATILDDEEANGRIQINIDDVPDPTSVTYIDYDNPFDLVQDAAGVPSHIMRFSRFGWVGCGDDFYVLECMGKGYIKIEPKDDEEDEEKRIYTAYFVEPIPQWEMQTRPFKRNSRFRSPRVILTADNLEAAVRGCDKFATSKVLRGDIALGLHRTARWRKDPATDSQKRLLEKRLNSFGDEKKVDVESMTKGQAANMITRLSHGARGRYVKKMNEKIQMAAKQAKEARKEILRRTREQVTVGPLPIEDVHDVQRRLSRL